MPKENKTTKDKLGSISKILDKYLERGDTESGEVRLIDEWLDSQVRKIRLQKLGSIENLSDHEIENEGEEGFNSMDYQNLVFENLPDMDVFLIDKNYQYIFSGGKEKEKFNKTNSDYVGKTMYEVFDKQDQRKLFPFYNKVLNGERTEGEVRLGKNVYYLVAVPVKNYTGEVSGGIIISQNVTSDKLLEESLIKSKEKAQKADRAKSLFIANISHEIRTPLNSIIGFTEQLEKTSLTEDQTELLNHVKNASDHLLDLVQEIVFLFKLGMDKVHIEKTDFSLDGLLEEISEIIMVQVGSKGLEFSITKDQSIPAVINGDPFRIRQILMNLLVNAVKYTDSGSINLSCSVQRETPKGIILKFQVSDTGVGIKKKDLPNIFEVFEQGHNKIDKVRGGAGLGLGICKKLVDLLKGEISVDSTINKGSIFTVILPFRKSEAEIKTDKKRTFKIREELLKGKKIFIADDDRLIRRLAELIMKSWKTDYTIVNDGIEAHERLKDVKYDIILLDIHMPGLDGVSVVRKLKSDNKHVNYDTPILALTANALKSDLQRYIRSGFDGYVLKPFKEAVLYNELCNTLELDYRNAPGEEQRPEYNPETPVKVEFDTTDLENTAGKDIDFYNDMLDEFIAGAKSLIHSLDLALGYNDREIIGNSVHKAIPSFRYFRINKTAELLEEIENISLGEVQDEKLKGLIMKVIADARRLIPIAGNYKKDNHPREL